MPIEYSINIAYSDIYSDYDIVDIKNLIEDIPTKMALELVCHYTAQIHTQEKNVDYQMQAIREWSSRFSIRTQKKIQGKIESFNQKQISGFNFINNVSSLLLIEFILENHNDLKPIHSLTPLQEENLFKAYLYFSEKWTTEQTEGALKYRDISIDSMYLVMMLPYSEILEFKDFRLQFLKAVYFFKFCENNDIFKEYLKEFLKARSVSSWNKYLFNLVSTYTFLLGKVNVKSLLEFENDSRDVFTSLENFCVDVETFKPSKDFLTLRQTPIFIYSENQLLFLNINFLIDKIYQAIMFDFADILINNGVMYKDRAIKNRQQFFGIFGDDFIEPGLFYEVMKHVFRQKDYTHFTGDELKNEFGPGTPDYLISDNRKIYVFEFKNTFFSCPIKYKFDIEQIEQELNKKFVANEAGKPKGVTQLVNFIREFAKGRYNEIFKEDLSSYIIYPILVTQDFTFNLPVIYSLLLNSFKEILKNSDLDNCKVQIKPITLIDFDLILKFQDLFISKKLTLNHVLNDYQLFLNRGTTSLDRALSFNKYLHNKTSAMKYDSPKMFMDESKPHYFKIIQYMRCFHFQSCTDELIIESFIFINNSIKFK